MSCGDGGKDKKQKMKMKMKMVEEEDSHVVGILGMGEMGKAVCRNLLGRGYEVLYWHSSSPSSINYGSMNLSEMNEIYENSEYNCYYSWKDGPDKLIDECKFTLALLSDIPNRDAPTTTVFGAEGVLSEMRKGKCYIDMSAVDAETAVKISKAITAKGGSFLEASILGSRKSAENGELIIFAAGDKALYGEATPLLNALGKKSFFLGEVGNGAKMRVACCQHDRDQGFMMAKTLGLEDDVFSEVYEIVRILVRS